jgi:succinate dehydrogenase / fumarate reductase flavoprotein subunit
MYHQFMELADVDITKQPMEVGPTTHYMMGGVRVDPDTGAATVPGLFAAGEASAGMHGANRLGGNSLSDLVVFGRRAGAGAARYAIDALGTPKVSDDEVQAEIQDLLAPFERGSGESPYDVHTALKDCMGKHVGIFRVQEDLELAVRQLGALNERAAKVRVTGSRIFNPGWHLARDLRNLLVVSEAITRSALLRLESRGAHSRLDFTGMDPALGKVNMCVTRGPDGMKVAPSPLPEMPADLKALFDAPAAPAAQPAAVSGGKE